MFYKWKYTKKYDAKNFLQYYKNIMDNYINIVDLHNR